MATGYSEEAFIDATNDGVVLHQDRLTAIETGRLTLTLDEINERTAWNAVRTNLRRHYATMAEPELTTVAQVLDHRVPPPLMGIDGAQRTAAGGQRNRFYFPHLHPWVGFETAVAAFQVDPATNLAIPMIPPLINLLFYRNRRMVNEEDEIRYLSSAIAYLEELGVQLLHRTETDSIGDMDRALSYIRADQKHCIAPVEGKSTQNLLLPVGAVEVANSYNNGYATMLNNSCRSREWCHVCHPLAQLFRQMKNNRIRFGVLTCATRTYFVYVQDTSPTDRRPVVRVSKAHLVGENNYLRAWAYFADLARTAADGPFTCPSENWGLASTPPNAVNEVDEHDDDNNDDAASNQGVSERDSSYVPSDAPTSEPLALATRVPFVCADDLEIEDPIGYGRNGAVFRVWWKGQAYALKQFDTAGALGLQSYNRELQAYAMLQKAWGVLVPKPVFLSELDDPTIKFLGLQLGRVPTDDECRDKSFGTESGNVLRKLSQKFGFEHLDAEVLRNWLYIPTGDPLKPERLVLTDLEDYRKVRVPPRKKRQHAATHSNAQQLKTPPNNKTLPGT